MATSSTKDTITSPNPTNLPSIFQELDLQNPTEKENFIVALKGFHHGTHQPQIPDVPPFPAGQEPTRYPETLGPTITIKEIEGKGLGLFAARDISPGTVLLFELPLISYTKTDRSHSKLSDIITDLTPARRKAWYSLHAHMANSKSKSIDVGILNTNGFGIEKDTATGVFETASRINHSCVPNSMWDWKEEGGRMLFWNRWALMEGEEVTVDYGHSKRVLRNWYGFECDCGGCTDSGSESEEEQKVVVGKVWNENVREKVGILIREMLGEEKCGEKNKFSLQENSAKEKSFARTDEDKVVGGAGADSDDYSDDYSDGVPENNGFDGDDEIDGADWARYEERGWMGGRG